MQVIWQSIESHWASDLECPELVLWNR